MPNQNHTTMMRAAVTGDNQHELAAEITSARAQNLDPVFEEVDAAGRQYRFPVYAQVVHSNEALIVRAYGLQFVFKASNARLFVEGARVSLNTLPTVNVPFLDNAIAKGSVKKSAAAAVSPQGTTICEACVAVIQQFSPERMPKMWNGKIDPWQVSPDYVPYQTAAANSTNMRRPDIYVKAGCPSGATCYSPCMTGFCTGTLYGYFSDGPSPGGGGYDYVASNPDYCTTSGNSNTDPLVNKDPHLQSMFKMLSNLGIDPNINNVSNQPYAASASMSGPPTINWDQANVTAAGSSNEQGGPQSANQILFHEADHIFYYYQGTGETSAPMGSGQSGTVSTTIDGYSVTYNLGTASGLDGYQHLLIHNDLYNVYGSDNTGALYSALSEATSVSSGGKAVTLSPSQMWNAVSQSHKTPYNTPTQPKYSLSSQLNSKGASCPQNAGSTTASYTTQTTVVMEPQGSVF